MRIEDHHVAVAGVRWHVSEAGDGPPLLLVHGWPQHGYVWRKVLPDLAQRHRVIAPDLPGFGRSDAPAGRYAKEELAQGLLDLLDTLGLDRVRVMGHDWGGYAAQLAALRAPERIERLVVLSIIHPWLKVERPGPLDLARASYQLILATPGLGERVLRHTPFVTTVLRRGAGPGFRWSEDELRAYAEPLREPARARASSALYRTWLREELPALAKGAYAGRRLAAPTLLLTGAHDPVVTPERIAGLEEHADEASTGVVPGAGHFLPEEQPEALLDRVRPFLAA